MSLIIDKPGPLSLLQDLGRHGHQYAGVSVGGPMDEHAFQWANHLLDNPANAAQIEISVGLFGAQFTAATTIALCGAEMQAKLNGQDIANWHSHRIEPGDRLELASARRGLRSYLAIRGGFQAPQILGSCATVVREGLGGVDTKGGGLTRHSKLHYHPSKARRLCAVPDEFISDFPQHIELGFFASYQWSLFSTAQQQTFLNSRFDISQQIDRMGYRLSGPAIDCQQTIVSEGITLGAIQIPPDGQPIVLMRDRQTIGGYPKLGCVCMHDVNRLSQGKPGDTVSFYLQDLDEAAAQYTAQRRFFESCQGSSD